MNLLRNISIRYKLIFIITLVTFTSLGVGFSIVMYYQINSLKSEAIESTSLQAQLLGEYSVTALAFEDRDGAREILSKMQTVPSVMMVILYDASGREFSSYRKSGFELKEKRAGIDHYEFDHGLLHISRKINYKKKEYGSIYMVVVTEQMESRIAMFLLILISIGAVALAVTFFLAQRLQKIISSPILGLADVMESIKNQREYSVRVKRDDKDEVGALYDGFNSMLDVIQIRKEERDKADRELSAEKERLLVTLQSIGDGVISTDLEGRIVMMNGAAEKLTGYLQAEGLGKKLKDIYHIVDQRDKENIILTKILGLTELSEQRKILISRDGLEKIISDSISLIHQSDGNPIGVVIAFRDITEKIKMDAEILKSRKIESVGVLAAGIAHDFNNILTSIIGNLGLVRISIDSKEMKSIKKGVEQAEKAALRAKDLTRQLLTFSKGGAPIRTAVSIASIVHDTATFALHGSNAIAEFDIPENLSAIDADEGQISQVINNLVINAKQAMPNGGKIFISVKEYTLSQSMSRFGLQINPGRYIGITISDQGIGIPPEFLDKIFDPYFTTKESGTGLGLASSYSIIKNHNGLLTVSSQINIGTVFEIYLPVSEKQTRTKPNEGQDEFKGRGKILIMDDEDIIREMAVRILTRFGYTVEEASDGKEAIQKYEAAFHTGKTFDLVILDLTIPGGMGGRENIEHIRRTDPKSILVVSSGYSNDDLMANPEKFGINAVLSKPYTIESMTKIVREVLTKTIS